ncbi:MAG: SMC-Scp complex subunit ScpB [Alphaproteobacteria bacterium]|nr:SMC-Scp complex subunit ScpB [Alphaproteobacteria bacterium]
MTDTPDQTPDLRLLEAVIFASSEPATTELLSRQFPEGTDMPALLDALKAQYEGRGVNLVETDGQWSFRTAPDLAPNMKITRQPRRKLPRAAAEVLAIIAYHQPLTRGDIESIRGVETSRGTLDILLELGWIRPGKRRDTPGRPLTWSTTPDFLSHFNLSSLKDLPGLDELKAAGLLDPRPVISDLPREGEDPDTAHEDSSEEEEFAAWIHEESDEDEVPAEPAAAD